MSVSEHENKEWDAEAVKQALVPESLSLAADAYRDSLQSVRRKIGTTFRLTKQARETGSAEVELH
jgi:hypothetical protein